MLLREVKDLIHIVQFSSVQLLSCLNLCNPMDCSTPGLPVHHQLLDFPEDVQGFLAWFLIIFIQFSSVAQSCPTPCDPMNRSTPGLPVHHQLPQFTQTRVH